MSIAMETSEMTVKTLPNVHSGGVLLVEFLKPLGISQAVGACGECLVRRINEIASGKRGITVDTAIRLGLCSGCE